MTISKKEYLLLKKLYRKNRVLPESDERTSLLDKKLITTEIVGMDENGFKLSDLYEITNAGIIAFEDYRFSHSTVKWTSIRSWIAIIISLIALSFTAINIYLTHFKP